MKLYDEGNTGIAMTSGFVETHAGNLHVYADRTQAGNIVFITTDNFKNYIPIEWIKKWYKNALSRSGFMGDEMVSIADMLEQWEEEK